MAKNKTFADRAIKYFTNLSTPKNLPDGIEAINPYDDDGVKNLVKRFYKKYYADNENRLFLIGINPGRFGGGLTGISFTDPVSLRDKCRINNNLGTRKELSSIFVYKIIERFGGVDKFFSMFFLTALYPLALVKEGKNYNYYDEKQLFKSLREEIVKSVSSQIDLGARRDKAIILGRKSSEFFGPLNEDHKFFKELSVLDHPRYIMQYKMKKIEAYITDYLDVLV